MSHVKLRPLALVVASFAFAGSLASCAHPTSSPSAPVTVTQGASATPTQPQVPGSVFDTDCSAVVPQSEISQAFGDTVPAKSYEMISADVSALGGALLIQSGALVCQWGSWASNDPHLAVVSAIDGGRSEFERNKAKAPGISRPLAGEGYDGYGFCTPWIEHAGQSTYSCTINVYQNHIWMVGRFDGLPSTSVLRRAAPSPGTGELAGVEESSQLVRALVEGASIVAAAPRLPRFDAGAAALHVPSSCAEIASTFPLRKAFTWEGNPTVSGGSAVYTGEGQFRLAIDRSGALQCVGATPLPLSSSLTITILPAGAWTAGATRLPEATFAPVPELGPSGLFACPPSEDGGGNCSLRLSESGSLVSIDLYGTNELETDRQLMITLAQSVLNAMRD
jgi:hypothetical protein